MLHTLKWYVGNELTARLLYLCFEERTSCNSGILDPTKVGSSSVSHIAWSRLTANCAFHWSLLVPFRVKAMSAWSQTTYRIEHCSCIIIPQKTKLTWTYSFHPNQLGKFRKPFCSIDFILTRNKSCQCILAHTIFKLQFYTWYFLLKDCLIIEWYYGWI